MLRRVAWIPEVPAHQQQHAGLLAAQATRGGRVKLAQLAAPPSDYDHPEKGDALHAMELTLALEKARLLHACMHACLRLHALPCVSLWRGLELTLALEKARLLLHACTHVCMRLHALPCVSHACMHAPPCPPSVRHACMRLHASLAAVRGGG
jgi:hypothetical protein